MGISGGALGGQVYRANDAPQYIRAHSACAALMFCQIVIILVYKYLLIRINRKRDNLTPEEYRKACEGDELCDLVRARPSMNIINMLMCASRLF